jgi:hypothetical protein
LRKPPQAARNPQTQNELTADISLSYADSVSRYYPPLVRIAASICRLEHSAKAMLATESVRISLLLFCRYLNQQIVKAAAIQAEMGIVV